MDMAKFFHTTLPHIQALAKDIFAVFPDGLPYIAHGDNGVLWLERNHAAVILANMFLCQLRPNYDIDFPMVTFLALFETSAPQEVAKLQCFIQYFVRIQETPPTGYVAVRRLAAERGHDWAASTRPLTSVDFQTGVIEDCAAALQADFANQYLGGGVLCGGCVQEEIRFACSPEATAACALCPVMRSNEAICISGTERYTTTAGYAFSLRYGGDYRDSAPRVRVTIDGPGAFSNSKVAVVVGSTVDMIANSIVAIDAIPFSSRGLGAQLGARPLHRELNKALVGFGARGVELEHATRLSTGNWGCGAFNGNLQVKFLVQWLAASEAGRDMVYYPFSEVSFGAAASEFVGAVRALPSPVSVAHLYRALIQVQDSLEKSYPPSLFDAVLGALRVA